MKSVKIKGKDYIEVNERIKEFHKLYKNGSITTNFHSCGDGVVIMKAKVTPDVSVPERVFTGVAYEKENSTFINKTSYIENCETSAVGRALGMLGIGIDTSIASAEEVNNAIKNQNTPVIDVEETDAMQKKATEISEAMKLCTDKKQLTELVNQYRPEVNKMSNELKKWLSDEKISAIKQLSAETEEK